MTLVQKQQRFSSLLSLLIIHARSLGYELTLGEVWRSPEMARLNASKGIGSGTSLHCSRLAVDLNLFRNGQLLVRTVDYLPLGEWWEKQSEFPDFECAWGGRFSDGNHFSFAHNNMR